jgi:hypothetical protein
MDKIREILQLGKKSAKQQSSVSQRQAESIRLVNFNQK